jgi:hypothetical protein
MSVPTNITMQIATCRAQIEIEQEECLQHQSKTLAKEQLHDEGMPEWGTNHKTLADLP